MPFELFYMYASDQSYGLDWIWVSIYVTIVDWLDWVIELMDWIGLDLENWTHVQLCDGCILINMLSYFIYLILHKSSGAVQSSLLRTLLNT